MPTPLTLTPLTGIPLIHPGDDIAAAILRSITDMKLILKDGDIFVLAQKIVSKAEGRIINLNTIIPSSEAVKYAKITEKDPRLIELILKESQSVLRACPGVIIVEHRLGFVCANAGIDHSNVGWASDEEQSIGVANSLEKKLESNDQPPEEWVLLLPEDPDRTARSLRNALEKATNKKLGFMIIDSHGRAWRMGTVGVAIGLASLPGVIDLRGESDIFGYKLRATQIGVADELAAAASLVMGQAAERCPIVHVRGFPYRLRETSLNEVLRPKEMDLFR